jgi:hypothetical protein
MISRNLGSMSTNKHNPPSDLFTPKLLSMWREGYGLKHFKSDALAGLTVAIVALPLSMAIQQSLAAF